MNGITGPSKLELRIRLSNVLFLFMSWCLEIVNAVARLLYSLGSMVGGAAIVKHDLWCFGMMLSLRLCGSSIWCSLFLFLVHYSEAVIHFVSVADGTRPIQGYPRLNFDFLK